MGSCNIGALSKIMEDRRRMDLIKAIEELRREKEKLERVIASLEELKAPVAGVCAPVRSRRGRKSMSPEERREVSARMKKYWANRLASR